MIHLQRLAEANHILDAIDPSRLEQTYRLIVDHGMLHLVITNRAEQQCVHPARIYKGLWLNSQALRVYMSATVEGIIVQLIHFVHNRPRLAAWRLIKWYGENSEVARRLLASSYDDAAKTRCIRCGSTGEHVRDWWRHGSKSGPCCVLQPCVKGSYDEWANGWKANTNAIK